jgi:hypothetical protein
MRLGFPLGALFGLWSLFLSLSLSLSLSHECSPWLFRRRRRKLPPALETQKTEKKKWHPFFSVSECQKKITNTRCKKRKEKDACHWKSFPVCPKEIYAQTPRPREKKRKK